MGNASSSETSSEPIDDHLKNSQKATERCRDRSKSCELIVDATKSILEQIAGHNSTYFGTNNNFDNDEKPENENDQSKQGSEGSDENSDDK
jgi:hypothetical protein